MSRTGNREDWEELSILTQMSETEICDHITHADKCSMQDVKEDWTFIVAWNTEHMKQYRLYFDEDGNKKVVVADL